MHSCVSLVHFGVGEVQLNDMRVENALLAPFLYFAFVLLVVLIMINMFLAIINDAYRQVTHDAASSCKEVSLQVTRRDAIGGAAAARQAVARRVGGAAGRRFAERVEREKSEAEAAAEAEAKEEVVATMMAAERAKTTASHLYAAGEVTNELKALCFRQDRGERGASATLRASFNTALDGSKGSASSTTSSAATPSASGGSGMPYARARRLQVAQGGRAGDRRGRRRAPPPPPRRRRRHRERGRGARAARVRRLVAAKLVATQPRVATGQRHAD